MPNDTLIKMALYNLDKLADDLSKESFVPMDPQTMQQMDPAVQQQMQMQQQQMQQAQAPQAPQSQQPPMGPSQDPQMQAQMQAQAQQAQAPQQPAPADAQAQQAPQGGMDPQIQQLIQQIVQQTVQSMGANKSTDEGKDEPKKSKGAGNKNLEVRVSAMEAALAQLLEQIGVVPPEQKGVDAANGFSTGSGQPADGTDAEPMPAMPMGPMDPNGAAALGSMPHISKKTAGLERPLDTRPLDGMSMTSVLTRIMGRG